MLPALLPTPAAWSEAQLCAEVPGWMQYTLGEVTQAVLATAKLRPAEQSALLAKAAARDSKQALPRQAPMRKR